MSAPHIARNGSTLLLDKDWVRNSFMLPHVPNKPSTGKMSKDDKKWLYFTSASKKFVNTGLGGNFVLNPPPKFTRFADIPTGTQVDGVVTDGTLSSKSPTRDTLSSKGLGRYYSEAIDDNAYKVHLRFGVPEYKGLITFFTGFYDIGASQLAREGRVSFTYLLGRLIGTVVALPLLPLILAFKAAKYILTSASTKYYTSKPTMPLYWNRVNMIVSDIAMNKGLIPRGKFLGKGKGEKSMYEIEGIETESMTKEAMRNSSAMLRQYAPEWFIGSEKWGGGIDVQAIIGKPQIVQNKSRAQLRLAMSKAKTPQEMADAYDNHINKHGHDTSLKPTPINDYLKLYFESRLGNPDLGRTDPYAEQMRERLDNVDEVLAAAGGTMNDGGAAQSEATGDTSGSDGVGVGGGIGQSQYDELARAYATDDGVIYPVLIKSTDEDGNEVLTTTPPHTDDPTLMSLLGAGAQSHIEWLVLKVDAVETVSESFSNSTAPSEIQSTINGMSSKNQAARFSLSDFNTGFAGIDDVIGMVKSTISGVAAGLQLDGLVSLSGAGFVDIPERWEDSAADFPSSSYTMQLRAPYGDLVSQFVNIDVPLACMLAAALPISHGNQAYGSPFVCEMYIQGKNVIRLGMISSLSITRGTGNLGWSPLGSPLGIDVSFTVKDLSTIMHAPIDSSMHNPLNILAGIAPRDNAFADYLAVLGNMSVHAMTDDIERMKINLALKKNAVQNMFAPNHIVNALYSTGPGRVIQNIAQAAGQGSGAIQPK